MNKLRFLSPIANINREELIEKLPNLCFLGVCAGLLILAWFPVLYNLLLASMNLWLVWMPPMAISAVLIIRSGIISRVSLDISQSCADGDFDAEWRKRPYRLGIFLSIIILSGIWMYLGPWKQILAATVVFPLNSAWFCANDLVQMLINRSFWSYITIAIPVCAGYVCIERIVRRQVLMRAESIRSCVNGMSGWNMMLRQKDVWITSAYHKLGSSMTGAHEDAFRTWVCRNVKAAAGDVKTAEYIFRMQEKDADMEVSFLRQCIDMYGESVRACSAVEAVVRKSGSPLLRRYLQATAGKLVSHEFVMLIESHRLEDVSNYLGQFMEDIQRISVLAKISGGNSRQEKQERKDKKSNKRAHAEPGQESLNAAPPATDHDKAVSLLGLARNFKKEEVSMRRKQFAQIYHPDRAIDNEQRLRNQNKLVEINTACDFLLKNAK